MELKDIVMILAVILGPILAVRIESFLRESKEERNVKNRIFTTLMATRQARLSISHIEALNMIDIAFYGSKRWFLLGFGRITQSQEGKAVIDAWELYRLHLNQYTEGDVWNTEANNRFFNLLHCMFVACGYTFNKADISSSSYFPLAHAYDSLLNDKMKLDLAGILSGNAPITIQVKPENN